MQQDAIFGFAEPASRLFPAPPGCAPSPGAATSAHALPELNRPVHGRFFLGPNRAVVPKPIVEANRCILRHVAPKTLRKAL